MVRFGITDYAHQAHGISVDVQALVLSSPEDIKHTRTRAREHLQQLGNKKKVDNEITVG